MQCPQCQADLVICNSKLVSEVGSTDVYSVLTMICVNTKCPNYAGTDLNNPRKVTETVRNKVSQ